MANSSLIKSKIKFRLMIKSTLYDRSYMFALQIVKVSKILTEQRDYDLSRQLLRSGTAVGALLREAKFAQSRADFINKQSIALKEANETVYWLNILYDSGLLREDLYEALISDGKELVAMLVSSIKTLKQQEGALRR